MANSPDTMPIILDTDLTSWRAAQSLSADPTMSGPQVYKISLVASDVTADGTVQVTDKSGGINLLAPMLVSAGSPVGTILFYDNPTQVLRWRDFAVTGLTSTKTALYVWYR